MRLPRYPRVTVRPVSGSCPRIQDVVCTACGTTATCCIGDAAANAAAQHRWAHGVYTVCAPLITGLVAGSCCAAAAQWPQLEMSPPAAALVGGLAAVLAVRRMSPTKVRRNVTSVGRRRRDA